MTCAEYQRVSVSAPIAAPPCSTPATMSPAHRRQPRDVDRDDRRPVGALIPGQQVSGQREREDQPEQREARQPRQLARRLVGAERDHPQHVQRRGDDDEAGAEVMEPANEAAGVVLLMNRTLS